MDWHISGAYLAACTCTTSEHWLIPGTSIKAHEACRGVVVFRVETGQADDIDLSGVDFAIVNSFPQAPSTIDSADDGREIGVIISADISEEQAQSIEAIVSAKSGGAFGHLLRDGAKDLGLERASFSVAKSASPIVKIEGSVAFRFEPNTDAGGAPSRGGTPMFAFGSDRLGGKTQGPPAMAFGHVFTPHFGEYARFDLAHKT